MDDTPNAMVRAVTCDVSKAFLQRLQETFPLDKALYDPDNMTKEQAAARFGEQRVIKWIAHHARIV